MKSAHRNDDDVLNNTSTIHSKYVVNQNLEHFDVISFRELLVRIKVFFLQHKICPKSNTIEWRFMPTDSHLKCYCF
jgi:hypothetical protein